MSREASKDNIEVRDFEFTFALYQIFIAMKPTFENLLTLAEQGVSIKFNPEMLSFNNVRRLVSEASHHSGCTVTLHYTDVFSIDNWRLLGEEASGHLQVWVD